MLGTPARISITAGQLLVVWESGALGSNPGRIRTGLHGRVWDPVATHLRGWSCRAVDLRGHGYSLLPAGADLAWEGFGRDAGRAADHAGPGMVGVGHSLGAVALLMASAEDPERFSLLVLHEPAMRPQPGPVPAELLAYQRAMVTMTRARRAIFPSRAEAMAAYAGKPPFAAVQAASLSAYVEHGFRDTDDGQVTLRCTPETEAETFARTHDHDLLSRLDAVTCPVFVVRGDETAPELQQSSDDLARIFGREALVLDGTDHFGPLGQPARFARIVQEAATSAGVVTTVASLT
ncbi:alpha/beta hydrolase [Streptomyces sp. NPDC005799]|uniref:alpha/beta fold hydrolase n=1 Tax=Streptomyces sp. NPDC005799 TaxID=3154678 RepID=UPI0033EB0249